MGPGGQGVAAGLSRAPGNRDPRGWCTRQATGHAAATSAASRVSSNRQAPLAPVSVLCQHHPQILTRASWGEWRDTARVPAGTRGCLLPPPGACRDGEGGLRRGTGNRGGKAWSSFPAVASLILKQPQGPSRRLPRGLRRRKEGKASPSHKKQEKQGVPGWLSQLSVRLQLRSRSHGPWVRAPHQALG